MTDPQTFQWAEKPPEWLAGVLDTFQKSRLAADRAIRAKLAELRPEVADLRNRLLDAERAVSRLVSFFTEQRDRQ